MFEDYLKRKPEAYSLVTKSSAKADRISDSVGIYEKFISNFKLGEKKFLEEEYFNTPNPAPTIIFASKGF